MSTPQVGNPVAISVKVNFSPITATSVIWRESIVEFSLHH
jgi:hypothetical protein